MQPCIAGGLPMRAYGGDTVDLPTIAGYAPLMFGLPLALAASLVAIAAAAAAWSMTRRAFRDIRRPPRRWTQAAAAVAGLLGGALVYAVIHWHCQQTPEVQPAGVWSDARVVYHALLIVLLVSATATDLESYYIPDGITVPGMGIGVALAVVSGDLQLAHVWVDWNEAIPQIRGPYLPLWLSTHPHLHGLAWSATGLITGGALTWAVRGIAGRLLGMEALGFGDVMLMAMIGSFLGWQPTVVAFLLAPLCAVVIGVGARLLGGKTYLPYGPYLALGALLVMLTWRWIWMFEFRLHEAAGPNDRVAVFAVRRLFGDWPSLLILAALLLVGLVLLLGLGRLYRMIPTPRKAD